MKKKLLKNYAHVCSILFVCVALLLASCQIEGTIIENPPVEDSIVPGSELAVLMQRAATEDRSFDDFIDFADCLSINLPFTIIVNELPFTISEENDYIELQAYLLKLNNDFDLDIVFPIVITLNDYTQIVINSQEELLPYIADCINQEEDIPCIEFVFPISFSIYDIEFELIDIVVINSNEELYLFIENIQEGTLVSLNFPVLLSLQNGDFIIEVNNNTELQEALEAADLDCNGEPINFACFEEEDLFLISCVNEYNDTAYFNLYNAVSACNENELFDISFYFTLQEAMDEQNEIENSIEFPLASPFTENIVFVRVTSYANPEEFRVYPLELFVNNCNEQVCDEETLNSYLNTCAWVTNGTFSFILTFENGIVTALLNGEEQMAKYFTASNVIANSGQAFTQFTIIGFTGDFATLNNSYGVGLCSEKYIEVYALDPNSPISFKGMERNCSIACDNPGYLTNDLIIYIPFGEEAVDLVSGEKLIDEAITYVEDRAGNPSCAAAFTANGAVIPITGTTDNSLLTQDAFSVSIWFQMANTEAGDLETFFQKGANINDGFSIGVYDLNTPLCFAENPPFSIWDTDWNEQVDIDWTNTDWHHLVITKTNNNVVQLWRDGILRNTVDGIDIGNETIDYYLGNNLVGNLDDLRVYKRVLNNDEINGLYELDADCFTCL